MFIFCTMEVRKPTARHEIHLTEELAASVLDKCKINQATTELLMTNVPPDDSLILKNIYGLFNGLTPLRTRQIKAWPSQMSHLTCLHCGGLCNVGSPLPAARQYDAQNDQYWLYGPFCRPCCSFGYICEIDSTSKQLAPTAELLRKFFGVQTIFVAPPRAAHQRFGGPLSDSEFYGTSGFTCLTTLQPPFVTYANYVVGVHHEKANTKEISVATLLPQSAGRLVGLTRPEERVTPLAEKKPSGKPPMLLEFLATLTSIKEIKDSTEEVIVKPTKKRSRLDDSGASGAPTETTNFLKQYVKKQS